MANKTGKQGRVRVFFAEFEGDDQTIQEGMRAMSMAVNKTFQPARVVKYLPHPPVEDMPLFPENGDEPADEDDVLQVDTSPAGTRQKTKRKLPVMSLVKNLDFCPEGKPDLKAFYAEKQPKTQLEEIAVFVFYLRQVLGIEGVTPNHVFTCFDETGARTPNDTPQIIRNTGARKGWVDVSASGIEITTRGITFVKHDLPANGKKD